MYSLTSFGTEGDVLHGDPAIALDEGRLNFGDVDGGVDGLPDVHYQLRRVCSPVRMSISARAQAAPTVSTTNACLSCSLGQR